MDILSKIKALDNEINEYISEVEKKIDGMQDEHDSIMSQRHKELYDFLEERRIFLKEMGFRGWITINSGIKDTEILINPRHGVRIRFPGYAMYNDPYGPKTDGIYKDYQMCNTDRYTEFLNSKWDKNIIDQNLYNLLSAEMTKKVQNAKTRLVGTYQKLEKAKEGRKS